MSLRNNRFIIGLGSLGLAACLCRAAVAQGNLDRPRGNGVGPGFTTSEAALVDGQAGWKSMPLFTVGETVGAYRPAGILDGMGIVQLDARTVRVFANHELLDEGGYVYELANGTDLTGARVSYFDIDSRNRKLLWAGLAYHTVVDRYGQVVTSAAQINEGANPGSLDGFDRFCSAWLGLAGQYGLEDDIYFTGEETGNGQEWALDVRNGVLWCVPALGRAAFENVVMVAHPDPTKVAFLIGDDRAPGPLLLYVGTKNALGDGSFLDRNGLARGKMHVWVSDSGDANPSTFHGTGATRAGHFVEIPYYNPANAGTPGYDAQGYANQARQDALVAAAHGFLMARPEDLSTNPSYGSQAVMVSTGRSALFGGVDAWGDVYIIDFDLSNLAATLTIAYDCDDAGGGQFTGPDYGLRSPDNLVWASNGMVYVQEDAANNSFGTFSGEEASIWQLDPTTGAVVRMAQMNRDALPSGQVDNDAGTIGAWETSGVIDVTNFFRTSEGEQLLLLDVQAHTVGGPAIGGGSNLVEGGQLLFLSFKPEEQAGLSPQGQSATGGTASDTQHRAWPNPFNPMTKIQFSMDAAAAVRLDILDVRGRLVKTLVDERLPAGSHGVLWDGTDSRQHGVVTGVYFYNLQVGDKAMRGKLLLAK